MVKKLLIILIVQFLILPASIVFASHTPLGRDGRASFADYDSPVTLVSYNANLRMRTGFTSVSLSMTIRNDSAEQLDFLMGMPTEYDQFSVVENLSVILRREALRVRIRRNVEQVPQRWYAWIIPLTPGETVVVDTTFSIGNKTTPYGGEIVTLPLSYLGAFKGAVANLRIVADLDFHGAYSFHPSPTIMPIEYGSGGRLSFVLDGFDTPQGDLEIYFIPLLSAIPNYIEANTVENLEVSAFLNLFRERDFSAAITSIDNFIVANPAFPLRRELEFLKAMAYAELGLFDQVKELYERLEHRLGFIGELTEAVRQKIIYDTALMLTLDGGTNEALEYLKGIDASENGDVFSIWLQDEIRRLTPPPPPPPPPPEPEPAPQEPIVELPPAEEDAALFPISPEMIIIIILAAILIIILILRGKRRKKRKFYFSKG